jgi:hypothetical protein
MQQPVIFTSLSPNSLRLSGATWAAPLDIGTTAPAMGFFTTVDATTGVFDSLTLGSSSVALATAAGFVRLEALNLTAKGALITANGTSGAVLPVGANNRLLMANSASLLGLEYVDSVNLASVQSGAFVAGTLAISITDSNGYVKTASLDLFTKGSLITSDGTLSTVLSSGTNNQLLRVNTATATGLEWTSNLTGLSSITTNSIFTGSGEVAITDANGQLVATELNLTVKGSLVTSVGGAASVLTPGANDTFLIADSAATDGIKWGNSIASITVTNTATVGALVAGSSNIAVTSAAGFVRLEAINLTTKGDLISHDGTQGGRLAVGSDGQFLRANSASTFGIEWSNVTTSWSGLTDPTANLSLAMSTFTSTFTWGNVNGLTLINSSTSNSPLVIRNTNTTTSAPLLAATETSGNLLLRVARSTTDSTSPALQFYNSTSAADLRTFFEQQITTNQFVFNTTARFRFIVNTNQILDIQNNHLEATSGSTTAPSYSFSAETNTGMFRDIPLTIGFAISGSEKARLNNRALSLRNGSHLCTQGTIPTATPQAALGTSGQSASLSTGSTDVAGRVTFTRGTVGTPATGLAVRITFASSFLATPFVVFAATNANAALEVWYATNITTTGFTLATNGVLVNSTTYVVDYIVIGQIE